MLGNIWTENTPSAAAISVQIDPDGLLLNYLQTTLYAQH